MARVRSPNYPAISLPEAIRRAEAIYNQEGQNPASRETMVRLLGFSSLNGASMAVLSALIKYELLEQAKDGDLRISDLALTIIYPESDHERASALRTAANAPSLFAEINERWPDRPPSDENLKAYLARRGFNQRALDGVISAYRDTVELAIEPGRVYDPGITSKRDTPEKNMDPGQFAPHSPPRGGRVAAPSLGSLRVAMTNEALEVTAALEDQDSVERLIKILEANKSLLPKKGTQPIQGEDDSRREDPEAEELE